MHSMSSAVFPDALPKSTPTSCQYNHEDLFPGTQQASILGVWTAPGAPETTPKGGARSAPPFGVVYGAPGAVQTPKIYDLWVPEK